MSYNINIKGIMKLLYLIPRMKLILDVDGVVIKSVDAMCQLLNEKYDTNASAIDVKSWNFREIKSDLTPEEIEELFSDERFFDIVEFYDGVLELINTYSDRIMFCSKGNCDNIKHKRKLFNSFGLYDIPLIGLPLEVSKSIINMQNCIFIDDCVKNLNESNAEIKILFREYDNGADWQIGWDGLEMNGWTE